MIDKDQIILNKMTSSLYWCYRRPLCRKSTTIMFVKENKQDDIALHLWIILQHFIFPDLHISVWEITKKICN